MTKPATDEEIETILLQLNGYGGWEDETIRSLIARIRSEQKEARNGKAAAAVMSELCAIIPINDIIGATETGATLVAYYRSVLSRAEAAEASEALASSIREKTIRECAAEAVETAKDFAVYRDHWPHRDAAMLVSKSILALLEQKP